jgi:hypothetical protein
MSDCAARSSYAVRRRPNGSLAPLHLGLHVRPVPRPKASSSMEQDRIAYITCLAILGKLFAGGKAFHAVVQTGAHARRTRARLVPGR